MVDSSNDDGVDMDKQRKTFLISFRRPPSSAAAETGDQDQRNDLELLETVSDKKPNGIHPVQTVRHEL